MWEGKYKDGKKVAPQRIKLPFQDVETINESVQDRQLGFDLFSTGRPRQWRNRLIWGDKKYVLPSLLDEFGGQIKLIYIDPPFATGDNFSFNVDIEGEDVTKQASALERKAYHDIWGSDTGDKVKSLDAYARWFYETASFLCDLLREDGSIYVHCDYRVNSVIRLILDEVFGPDNFRNEIVVKRRIKKNLQAQFDSIESLSTAHDVILWYSKSPQTRYKLLYIPMENKKEEGYWHHFWSNADRPTMRYELLGVTPPSGQWKWNKERAMKAVENYETYLKEAKGRSVAQYWVDTGERLEFIRLSSTGKVENWFPPAGERLGDTLWIDIHAYENEKEYATQKHTDLVERIIQSSTEPDDLVLDCFVGSGTTAVAAEKTGRRWVAADFGRFAIHTTRKRLLSIANVRPFVVQNMGKYERQRWQQAEFGDRAASLVKAYTDFILKLYNAEAVPGYSWLHGVKGGRYVHVGAVDAPVTPDDVQQAVLEWKRNIGQLAASAGQSVSNAIDFLGWEFSLGMNEETKQVAKANGVDVNFVCIPYEVLDKKALAQQDITFFELAALDASATVKGRALTLRLNNFTLPPSSVPENVRKELIEHVGSKWDAWIDYWAIDWDYKDDTFHNQWQTYRSKKQRDLQLQTVHEYERPGRYVALVKVIDVFGNDTTKSIEIEVK